MLSAGFSGFSANHSDVGGYSVVEGIFSGAAMVRSKELLFRWMELAAFTAAFRTQEGLQPDQNVQFYSDEGKEGKHLSAETHRNFTRHLHTFFAYGEIV